MLFLMVHNAVCRILSPTNLQATIMWTIQLVWGYPRDRHCSRWRWSLSITSIGFVSPNVSDKHLRLTMTSSGRHHYHYSSLNLFSQHVCVMHAKLSNLLILIKGTILDIIQGHNQGYGQDLTGLSVHAFLHVFWE